MKILQLHNRYIDKGGEDTVLDNERLLLEQNGNEVQLCEFSNLNNQSLPKITLFFKTIFNRHSYRKVIHHLETFQPDVVHIHNIYFEASPAVFIALKKKKVPTVMTIHNYRFGCIQGLLYRDNAVCTQCFDKKTSYYGIKHKCFDHSLIKSFQITLITSINKFIIRHFNPIQTFIFLTPFIKEMVMPILFPTNAKAILKPNYVRDFGFSGAEGREDYYLFLGRLNEQKGIKQLLDIFTKTNRKLQILGSGPLEDLVQQTAQSHPNITYLGFADMPFILEKLKKCKALIVPSITYEGQPMTIIEAFSTGTPVFASNIKNLDTIITNNKTGFLFTPTTAESIFTTFESLPPQDRAQIYTNARQEYEQKYSPQSNYTQLINIYQSIS